MKKQNYSVTHQGKEELGLQQKYMFTNGKSVVKGNSKESRSRMEAERGVEKGEVELRFSLDSIHQK